MAFALGAAAVVVLGTSVERVDLDVVVGEMEVDLEWLLETEAEDCELEVDLVLEIELDVENLLEVDDSELEADLVLEDSVVFVAPASCPIYQYSKESYQEGTKSCLADWHSI